MGEPLWILFVFLSVGFFACVLCIVATGVGICQWKAGLCCCCRRSNRTTSDGGAYAVQNHTASEFTKVQASLGPAPGVGGYGAMDQIEYPEPIVYSDSESTDPDY